MLPSSSTEMRVLLLRPVPANERFGLGPFFRIEPLETHLRRARPGLVGIATLHALETDDVLALRRTQRMMDPAHYLAECNFASPPGSFTASFASDARKSLERSPH